MVNYWVENTNEPLRFMKCLWMPDSDTGRGAGWQHPHEMKIGDLVLHHFSADVKGISHGFNGYSTVKEIHLSITVDEIILRLIEIGRFGDDFDKTKYIEKYGKSDRLHLVYLDNQITFTSPIETQLVATKVGNVPGENKVFDHRGFITQMYLRKVNKQFFDGVISLAEGTFSEPPKETINISDNSISNILASKKQIILYGPPGTGKTYVTKGLAVKLCMEGK